MLSRFLLMLALALSALLSAPLAADEPRDPRDPGPEVDHSVQRLSAPLAADEPRVADNPHVWSPRTRSVAVFKNGLGFFVREGQVTLRDGWAVADRIPPAKFGTLAIYASGEDEVVDLVGSGPGETVEFDGVDVPRDAQSKRARLEAVKNLRIQLDYVHHGGERQAAGRLVSIGPDYAILENNDNSFAVPIAAVTRLRMLDLPLRVHVSGESGQAPETTTLAMAYLRDGIAWIPDYTLEVLDDGTAELTLRGTIVNEAEDLVNCDVHFVVGVPHFVHADYLAPIAVGQVIRTIGTATVPPGLQSQIMNRAAIVSNAMTSAGLDHLPQVVQEAVDYQEGGLRQTLGNLPVLEGPAGSDYTVYTQEGLTLRKGERAIVTLFKKRVTFGHVYRWSPPQPMKHFLTLQNDTGTAWTTGPCLAVSGGRPLSQDLLKYTPKGGAAEFPVSAAINVSHHRTEREIDRTLKAHSPSTHTFLDLVTLAGELRLHNFERSGVEIVVEAPVAGRPLAASDGGQLSADPEALQLLSRAGTVRWTVALEPNETKTLTYSYERYVPSS